MKALSVKQPWANLIACGAKTIETRTWSTCYRGPLLIASSRMPNIPPAGCAVAVARLVTCRPMTTRDEKTACCELYPRAVAWELESIHAVVPIPMRGARGVYDCPLELSDLSLLTPQVHLVDPQPPPWLAGGKAPWNITRNIWGFATPSLPRVCRSENTIECPYGSEGVTLELLDDRRWYWVVSRVEFEGTDDPEPEDHAARGGP